MPGDKSRDIAEILTLVTRVSEKLAVSFKQTLKLLDSKVIDEIEKMNGRLNQIDKSKPNNKEIKPTAAEGLQVQQQGLPAPVVEKIIGVRLESVSDDAIKSLKGVSPQIKHVVKDPEQPRERGSGLLSELGGIIARFLGPAVLGFLGLGLAALAARGRTLYDMITGMLTTTLAALPFFGPLYSFWNAYKSFKDKKTLDGLENVVIGLVGLLPLGIGEKIALISGIKLLRNILEEKAPKVVDGINGIQITPGLLATALGAIGIVIGSLGGRGFLKKLSLIGSAIYAYEAYEAFKTNSREGIYSGILSLGSAAINLFGPLGIIVASGLQLINSMFFDTVTDKNTGKTTIKWAGWAQTFDKWYQQSALNKWSLGMERWFNGILNLNIEEMREGAKEAAVLIPGLGNITKIIDWMFSPGAFKGSLKSELNSTKDFIVDTAKFSAELSKRMWDWFLNLLPEPFRSIMHYIITGTGTVAEAAGTVAGTAWRASTLGQFSAELSKKMSDWLKDEPSKQKEQQVQPKQESTIQLQSSSPVPTDVNTYKAPQVQEDTLINKKQLDTLIRQNTILDSLNKTTKEHGDLLAEIRNAIKMQPRSSNNVNVTSNTYGQGVTLRGLQGSFA